MNPSLWFLGLPVLKDLVSVSVTLQQEDEDLRSTRIKTCRELVLLYSDILASPALDSFSDITVITSIPFFQRGFLQVFGQRRSLQLGCPQCVSPGVLQCCLSYSLITRLAPSWNKAGLYLVSGKDFLTESGRLYAVSMELSTSEGQLCLSVEVNTVRLPPTRLEDFDFPPLVLRRFCSDPDSVLDPSSLWCHVLPSMKKGQIISITRQLPRDGPFRTYRDLQDHWNHLYGYRLPDVAEEEVVYCSVYFRLVGERLFTYPLSCVRLQPVQRCPRVDLQGALGSFLSSVGERLSSVCGFPARLTGKPRHHTVGLSAAATVQVFGGEQINLSTSSSSIRLVLTQLPPPPPRPVKPSFGSQPPAWTPLTQQDGAQGLLGNGLTQSQGCRGDRDWPSSSSSLSSFSSLFQTASSLSSSSSVLLPLPPPPMIFAPKLVPIFKNTCPSRHINMALLRLQRERLIGGGEERGRVTLPAFRMKTSTTSTTTSSSSSSSSSSLSATSLTLPPPFSRRPKPAPQPAGHIGLKRIASLSPASKSGPGFLLAPQPETTKPKTNSKTSSKTSVKSSSDTNTSNKRPPPSDIYFKRPPPFDIFFKHPLAAPPSDISNKCPPPSDVSNKRPPPSDISFKHPPPSDISFKRPPPCDFSFKHPLAPPPSDIFKHPPAAPPSDISNKRPPPSDVSNKRPPPSDISFKHPLAAPPSDISNKRPPPSDVSNKRPPPSDVSNKRPPPSDISFKRPPAAPPSDTSDKDTSSSSRRSPRVVFEESQPKKPRSSIRDVDVEQMARSNQLSQVNSSTLLSWLKARGVLIRTKHRKEDLMLKVMGCLAEA
ncbi:uncharacterized protein C18orf63 homolog isoform X2 [Cebidichthys violaceus]